MRKLVARSLAVATVAVLVSGCSSTGGQKSFSWSSLNPMNMFAKSDSDPPLPKPSEQMAPTVTLPNASDIAESGGTAPPSPYGQTGLGDTVQTAATQITSDAMGPQRGTYNLNGYAGSNLPVSSSSSGYEQYPPANSAYVPTTPSTSGYNSSATGQYALGGGNYDIQGQSSTPGLPAYANPTAPYGSNAAPAAPSNYQLPPMSSPSGYNSGLAQDPYGSTATPTYPGAASTSPATGTTGVPQDVYANALPANPSNTPDMVASLPSLPPMANNSTNSQVPYVPGDTGYTPPNVPAYTPPVSGGYVQPATATEPNYAPGSVSRYPTTGGSTNSAYGTNGIY